MLKLKKIVSQLKEEEAQSIRRELVANKAQNFLYLFESYLSDSRTDQEIMAHLEVNTNAFYVLKSRLYEKIQNALIGSKEIDKQEILRQLSNINQYIFETPRETAVAVLHKLEKDLLSYDLSSDLISVYSILKKIHLHSPKFYHYSQLYNQHVAYAMALEKAEDLLCNTTRTLSDYFFSRSAEQKDLLHILKREIGNVYALSNAHRIEFIRNIIIVQLELFAGIEFPEEESTEDLLASCEEIMNKFPKDNNYRYYRVVIDFLRFEYYRRIRQTKKTMLHFGPVNDNLLNWLLFGNTTLAYKFLLSKASVYIENGKQALLDEEFNVDDLLFDKEDTHTGIIVNLFTAVCKHYAGKTKEAISALNEALNVLSTKDSVYMEMEIKSSLSLLYYLAGELDLSANLVRSMYRKVNSLEDSPYTNVLDYVKLMNLLIGENGNDGKAARISKAMQAFRRSNTGPEMILTLFEPELDRLK